MERQIYEASPPIQLIPIDAVHIEVPNASDINQLEVRKREEWEEKEGKIVDKDQRSRDSNSIIYRIRRENIEDINEYGGTETCNSQSRTISQ